MRKRKLNCDISNIGGAEALELADHSPMPGDEPTPAAPDEQAVAILAGILRCADARGRRARFHRFEVLRGLVTGRTLSEISRELKISYEGARQIAQQLQAKTGMKLLCK